MSINNGNNNNTSGSRSNKTSLDYYNDSITTPSQIYKPSASAYYTFPEFLKPDDAATTNQAANNAAAATTSTGLSNVKKNAIGLFFVALMVTTIVVEGEYANTEYEEFEFKNYFFLCWIASGMMMVVYPCYAIGKGIYASLKFCVKKIHRTMSRRRYTRASDDEAQKIKKSAMQRNISSSALTPDDVQIMGNVQVHIYDEDAEAEQREAEQEHPQGVTFKKLLICTVLLSPLQIFSAYAWYYSLEFITVSMNLALFQTLVIFVFLLTVIILCERKQLHFKFASLVVCSIGVIFLAASAVMESKGSISKLDTIWGTLLVLCAAFMYALFDVLFSKLLGENCTMDQLAQFQTLSGASQFFLFWPMLVILHFTKVEIFVLPNRIETIVFIVLNGVFNVLYYVFDILALSFASPILVSICGTSAIPVAGLIDYLRGKQRFGLVNSTGMVCSKQQQKH